MLMPPLAASLIFSPRRYSLLAIIFSCQILFAMPFSAIMPLPPRLPPLFIAAFVAFAPALMPFSLCPPFRRFFFIIAISLRAAIAAAIIATLRRRFRFAAIASYAFIFLYFILRHYFIYCSRCCFFASYCFRCCISLDVTPFSMVIRRAPLFFAFILPDAFSMSCRHCRAAITLAAAAALMAH
jgi:hypothetical protein